MGEYLAKAGIEVAAALDHLERLAELQPHRTAIHSLENQGDHMLRVAIGDLFSGSKDPSELLKWKDIYDLLEATMDACEHTANVMETLAIKPGMVVVMSALLGAISWNLITWYRGLPSSSTHALIGGLCGAGIAAAHGLDGVRWSALGRQVASLIISPPLGFIVAGIFAIALVFVIYRFGLRPAPVNRTLRSLQVLTSAFLSYSHGANDAQKTMAAMTLALVAAGDLPKFQVPLWVVVLSAAAIGFGTYAGGWRIIRTLGWSILKLEPVTALSAQLMGATVIQAATVVGLPVSTTHVITGSVIGVGVSRKLAAVRWGLGASIVLAWIVTIPASAMIAWVAYAILHTAGLRG